jgi:hypothetical protein
VEPWDTWSHNGLKIVDLRRCYAYVAAVSVLEQVAWRATGSASCGYCVRKAFGLLLPPSASEVPGPGSMLPYWLTRAILQSKNYGSLVLAIAVRGGTHAATIARAFFKFAGRVDLNLPPARVC